MYEKQLDADVEPSEAPLSPVTADLADDDVSRLSMLSDEQKIAVILGLQDDDPSLAVASASTPVPAPSSSSPQDLAEPSLAGLAHLTDEQKLAMIAGQAASLPVPPVSSDPERELTEDEKVKMILRTSQRNSDQQIARDGLSRKTLVNVIVLALIIACFMAIVWAYQHLALIIGHH